MTFEELGLDVARLLNEARVPYMLTGALAVNFHGVPRSTHDVDVVVSISAADIARTRATLEPDFSVDEESIKAALREGGMFNAIHEDTGFKVDFWMLKTDEYSRVCFSRRVQVNVLGVLMSLPTAEDVVVIKLDWFKQSDIDKHFSDALGVYRIQSGKLDLPYIEQWCRRKSILDLWERLRREAGMQSARPRP